MKKTFIKLVALCGGILLVGSAHGITLTFEDTWIDWPGYSSSHVADEHGTPKVRELQAEIEGNKIYSVDVVFTTEERQLYESLFINTSYQGGDSWQEWDYFARNGYSGNSHEENTVGTEAQDGFYSVAAEYLYTTTIDGGGSNVRESNPNGIDAAFLADDDEPFLFSYGKNSDDGFWHLTYSFSEGLDISGGFFIAYTPWCANDVAGGGAMAPVPEPATMLLFGAGLLGVAGVRLRKRKQ